MLRYETVKPFLFAIMIIGFAAALFGTYRVIAMTQERDANFAYRTQQQQAADNTTIEVDQAEVSVLFGSQLSLVEIERARYEAVIITGVGLVLVAAGWLVNDVWRSRHRRALAAASEATP
jgi:Tfp pilus assembly protein PilN